MRGVSLQNITLYQQHPRKKSRPDSPTEKTDWEK